MRCIYLQAVASDAAVNMGVRVCVGVPASESFVCTFRSGIAESYVNSGGFIFNVEMRKISPLLKNLKCFSTALKTKSKVSLREFKPPA